ncbi:Gfo/Idh/MocA family protein [Zavarzinella formosa]|uniref:Gfo/Idh/MocA family protein n=1 Tax=Zavarzinella formosa TaxID=360055 RepID=UPI0002E4A860|nr:Gfo/Idh/MocA family oxidoreductase [Zavarzinella formosa]
MNPDGQIPRRQMLLGTAAALGGAAMATSPAKAEEPKEGKVFRIGVISANIRGKSQPRNGHTWHFAQYLHPTANIDTYCKLVDPGSAEFFRKVVRNPKFNFDQLPFPDTKITQYYDSDPLVAAKFTEAFPGVTVAKSVEEMVKDVDAVWLGDASGFGDDHFDLVAPGLRKGLPTFCDKPIGETVAGTRKILEFAKANSAPIMSSSLFRHEWGMEAALRKRDSGEFGQIQYVIASVQGGYSESGWMVYGQHPAWTVMTLMGPGVDAVSMYARESAAHALVTYKDRMPAEIWYGRPNAQSEYCHTEVHFPKKKFEYTASIEGDFWYGHHYEMFRMAATFREMVKTRKEPIPHQEILEVTAIVQAAAKSLKEQSRLVKLSEVM